MTSAGQAIRWGIIGTGRIAGKFATDLQLLPDAEIVAVGSRSQGSADAFGDRFHIARRYPSYAQVVEDPEVDAVYVSTPHPMHHSNALLAIRAGKAVLVEKPFTINANQARELVSEARAGGTFLMEAMWTRFLPHIVAVREILASGRLGDVRSVMAHHGQWFPENAAHRLFAPALGGGALLDLGIYPISLVSMVLGAPMKVTAVSTPAFTGVDAQTGVLLQYDEGRQAVVFTSLEALMPNDACISGTEARIEIEGHCYAPSRFRIVRRDGEIEQFDFSHEGNGLRHQAAAVGACLRDGQVESAVMPLDETVAIMETMDEIRRQIGLRYPGEK